VFDFVAEELEGRTPFELVAARGTVRIALKKAGLDPQTVTPSQMAVVLRRVMPEELRRRQVEDPAQVCDAIIGELQHLSPATDTRADTPEDVFRRIAG
jgi:hypothetical protein